MSVEKDKGRGVDASSYVNENHAFKQSSYR